MLWPGPVGGVGRGCTERCGQKAQVGGREGEREAHLSARCSHIAQVRLVGRGGRNEGGQITQACVGGRARCCCSACRLLVFAPTPSPLIQRRSQRCGWGQGKTGTEGTEALLALTNNSVREAAVIMA